MTEPPPIDLMWATLAACNGDRVEMSQAIDLLIECGETALAETLRWMLKNSRWPSWNEKEKCFEWRLVIFFRESNRLAREIWMKLSQSKNNLHPQHKNAVNDSVMDYATFPDAVNALRVALVENKIIQEVTT